MSTVRTRAVVTISGSFSAFLYHSRSPQLLFATGGPVEENTTPLMGDNYFCRSATRQRRAGLPILRQGEGPNRKKQVAIIKDGLAGHIGQHPAKCLRDKLHWPVDTDISAFVYLGGR